MTKLCDNCHTRTGKHETGYGLLCIICFDMDPYVLDPTPAEYEPGPDHCGFEAEPIDERPTVHLVHMTEAEASYLWFILNGFLDDVLFSARPLEDLDHPIFVVDDDPPVEVLEAAYDRIARVHPIHLVSPDFWKQDMAFHLQNNSGDRELAFTMTRQHIIQFYGYGVDYRLAYELPHAWQLPF